MLAHVDYAGALDWKALSSPRSLAMKGFTFNIRAESKGFQRNSWLKQRPALDDLNGLLEPASSEGFLDPLSEVKRAYTSESARYLIPRQE